MNKVSKAGKAVVTGASSGIGAVYAKKLAERGYDLILVARNRERLDKLAQHLRSETGREVEIVEADLGAAQGMHKVEEILRSDSAITMLVNNAGIGATQPLLASDIDKMEAMIVLNVVSPTRLTHAVAPGFVERGAGTIINIASIVAVQPELLNGVYGGSKAFVLAFTQSLHHELAEKGVIVQAVLPGATSTEFWDIAGTPMKYLPQSIIMSADDMVSASLAGLDRGELVTIPSLPDAQDWTALDDARKGLFPNLSKSKPAARYGVQA